MNKSKLSSRRTFLKNLSSAGLALSLPISRVSAATSKARIVIIGGGFGGASCAVMLKKLMPNLQVFLINSSVEYRTCPFSNLVISGWKNLDDITFEYDKIQSKYGITVMYKHASSIDSVKKRVVFSDNSMLNYDQLVVSPGIDFIFDRMEGYTKDDVDIIPHAYKAGRQTLILRRQLENMKDGGVFAIIPPVNPYRCPPGPYERASVVASYFKKYKPKSKILIFDPKMKFSKQALFDEGWKTLYGNMITWYSSEAGGIVEQMDVKNRVVYTEFGEESVDVINYIPPQKAGEIASISGLTDNSGWCPVNAEFQSKLLKDIYVIGDASIAGAMPKSGFSANNQGKYVALSIANELSGKSKPLLKLQNICYSYIGEEYNVSVSAVYESKYDKVMSVYSSTSPLNASLETRAKDADYAESWYYSITNEMFT